jgi:hypothetical protein
MDKFLPEVIIPNQAITDSEKDKEIKALKEEIERLKNPGFARGKVFAGIGNVRWTQTTNNFLPETHYNVAQIIAAAQGPTKIQHGSIPW